MEQRKNRRRCKNGETEDEIKGLQKQIKSSRTTEKESEKLLKNGKERGRR
jgi:hypothetical protein